MTQASKSDQRLRAQASLHVMFAHSMDALISGLYLWFEAIKIRIGGRLPEESHPETLHSFTGFALILPGYKIYTSCQGSYDSQ